MNKINAFTIMEVVITMMISAIVIAITYSSYSIVIKSYQGFTAKNEQMALVVTLDHLLKRDFDQAQVIFPDTSGITLTKNGLNIRYKFASDFVVRISTKQDTFKVQSNNVISKFRHVQIDDGQTTDEFQLIDEFEFKIAYHNEQIPFHFKNFTVPLIL